VKDGLPSAIESEKAVLSSILMDNDSVYLTGDLRADDFGLDIHRKMYSTMWEMMAAGETIDHISLKGALSTRYNEREADYVLMFDDDLMVKVDVEYHVRQILNASRRRQIVRVLEGAIAQAYDSSETNDDVISVTHERIMAIASASTLHRSWKISEYSGDVYAAILKLAQQDREVQSLGLTLGVKELDRLTTGLRLGEYYVIGAWAGEGKTAFAEQVIVANCYNQVATLMFSQEMSKEQVILRVIPQVSNGQVSARGLRDPREMNPVQMSEFTRTQEIIDSWPLWVNDASSFEVSQLVAHAYMMIRRHGIKLIVVDYLQLLKARGDKKYEQVSNASEALRQLAKSEKVVVVAISQLSRPDTKQKRAPTMFDLKESGQIEQDAHAVFLLYRPLMKNDQEVAYSGEDLIIIGKQREGPVGSVKVKFDSRRLMFLPRAADSDEDSGYEQKSLAAGKW